MLFANITNSDRIMYKNIEKDDEEGYSENEFTTYNTLKL
jgi:hypothetical protein